MENTKTPMKDKETKEEFDDLLMEVMGSYHDFMMNKISLNKHKAVEQKVGDFIKGVEQEAERRGEKRYGISLSEKADKPYIVIDDMKQGGKTIFAGTLEHIQINKLLEEENG